MRHDQPFEVRLLDAGASFFTCVRNEKIITASPEHTDKYTL